MSKWAEERKLFANHLLTWNLLNWGSEQGFRFFDFVGVNPNPESRSPREEGIYRFKARWGGRMLTYPIFSKVYAPRRHAMLRAFKRWFGDEKE